MKRGKTIYFSFSFRLRRQIEQGGAPCYPLITLFCSLLPQAQVSAFHDPPSEVTAQKVELGEPEQISGFPSEVTFRR